MSSKPGDVALRPRCGNHTFTYLGCEVHYCTSCGYLRSPRPGDLIDKYGVRVAGRYADEPSRLPVLKQICLPRDQRGKPSVPGTEYTPLAEESTKGKTDQPPTIDDLTPTALKLLTTLGDKKASDSEKAVRRDDIARQACTGNADSKHIRDAFRARAAGAHRDAEESRHLAD